MRNLVSNRARHRWEGIILLVVMLLVGWGGGWFRLTGACTGVALPPLRLALQRTPPSCVEAVPATAQVIGSLAGIAVGGLLLYWMDKELRR